MGDLFEVEPSPTRLVVDKEGKGRVHFKVRNTSDHEVRMRAQVVAEKRSEPSWFSIDGQPEETLASGSSATVVVTAAVPAGVRGKDYEVALEVADGSSAGSRPERGPGVPVYVNAGSEPHGRGFVATVIGAIIGGIVGFLVALILAGYEIGHGISKSLNSGWTFSHAIDHLVGSFLAGLILALLGALIVPWIGEVVGSGIALRLRRHWGIPRTMRILAVATPIWSIVAAVVVILIFRQVPGKQFVLPVVIWLVSLVIVPPIFSRMVAVAGRERAR